MGNHKEIKILFAEDMEADYEIAVNELFNSGLKFCSRRTEIKDDFIKTLNEFKPDIIISDYSMPQFDGMRALQITKEFDKSLPFIILTGTLNEEIAVDCMKAGATDYVIKEHIGKLSFAVKEAMRYRNIMLKKIQAEAALLESESRYRNMFEKNHAVMILLNSSDYKILDANPAAAQYYGYSIDELKNKNISDLSTEEEKSLADRYSTLNNQNHFYSQHILSNGMVRDVEIFLSPINYRGVQLSHCIIQDITDRNKAVEELRISLNEKKELIKEIYHRTKNNMQVIISMFSLQTIYSNEDKVEKILKDMENRIRAMALVHEKLYKSRDLSRLDLKEYLTELVYNIIAGYGMADKIKIRNNMMNVDVLIDTAIPCGIVVNELVTNVAKYAFPENGSGILTIGLEMDHSGCITLLVEDNGIGCKMDINKANNLSMGFQIVKNIVEYQLKGFIELRADAGMKWIIRFKDNVYNERV